MKWGHWRSWLVGALAAASISLPARAVVIDFEDVAPTLFSGSSITSGGYDFMSDGAGFSGVDSAGAFIFGNAPANAMGQFLFMLNGDGMVMSKSTGTRFFVTSFDASFVAPLPGLGAGIVPGELLLVGERWGGGLMFDNMPFTASDDNGDFRFATYGPGAFADVPLRRLGFFACVYQADGSCSFNALDVPPQFALDNIGALPEPASMMLVILALGAAGATARRRHR